MRLIIAGSRNIPIERCWLYIVAACREIQPTQVISGHCEGVDRAGEVWARKHGMEPVVMEVTREEWRDCARAGMPGAAGPIRNGRMVAVADGLLVIMHPDSRGSADVLRQAKRAELRIWQVILPR